MNLELNRLLYQWYCTNVYLLFCQFSEAIQRNVQHFVRSLEFYTQILPPCNILGNLILIFEQNYEKFWIMSLYVSQILTKWCPYITNIKPMYHLKTVYNVNFVNFDFPSPLLPSPIKTFPYSRTFYLMASLSKKFAH